MSTLPARAGRRCHHAVNPFHSAVYFSPELREEMAALGVTDPNAAYFASRAAAFGAVGPGTVTATFFNFRHDLVARHLPAVWEVATPAQVLDARLRAADRTLQRLLGEEAVAAPDVAEAAELALRAAEGCARPGRPLYAAHADLPVPPEPHLAYWHAATLLREHRGDAHLAALLDAELDPLEALISHTATGFGMAPKWVLGTRGWTQQEWDEASARLVARGILDQEGSLTEQGSALRAELEERTDRLDAGPYEHLGAEGTLRLTELAKDLLGRIFAAGAFPDGMLGRG
ncbi:hypothetical protein KQH42_02255 [Streptomyces sp. CHA1]|uniref:SCO6745 family protein n=1 Tax=Streptomyces TaxID=1883 RepID=UPI0003C2C202|nr:MULTISPECIES: hypothetical protein [unclassified Streptomyces]QOZ98295.1 hypothetical protein DI273_02830 [Streptomyces violascens]UYM25687.1 hypothetical protein NQP46_29870 [Streptomyces albus]WDV30669.1 hypothetical protein OIM90_02460 [Streptomyces sp. AD16]WSB23658.1 hypothetical protein OHB02_27410 [Streptomyces albidoflavus]ESQ01484.1 Hypothetical protein B591_02529 [Streptomyces sp. GBA 94-10 4N24]